MPEEATQTKKARSKIKEIFQRMNFDIHEEVPLSHITNNIGEKMEIPYQADFILTKEFVLELDPTSNKKGKAKGHGTRRRIIHDSWRDKNIKEQIDLVTVRLDPKDVLKQTEQDILAEVEWQLRTSKN